MAQAYKAKPFAARSIQSGEASPFVAGDINSFMQNNVMSTAGGFVCRPCGKFISSKPSMRRHAEQSHVMAGITYLCPMCKMTKSSKNTFAQHIYRVHPELKGIDFDQCVLHGQ